MRDPVRNLCSYLHQSFARRFLRFVSREREGSVLRVCEGFGFLGAGIQRNCEPEKKFFGPEQVHSTGYPQHPRTIARPTQASTARRAAGGVRAFLA